MKPLVVSVRCAEPAEAPNYEHLTVKTYRFLRSCLSSAAAAKAELPYRINPFVFGRYAIY